MDNNRSSDILGSNDDIMTEGTIRPVRMESSMVTPTSSAMAPTDTFTNVPSGLEVESATFHMPVAATCSSGTSSSGVKAKMNDLATKGTETVSQWKQNLNDKYSEMKPVVKEKIETMRTTTMERVAEMKTTVNDRVAEMKTTVNERVADLKSTVNDKVMTLRSDAESTATNVQTDMRVNPMKWAGIAAGTGLGLGMIGRLIDHRKHKHVRRHNVPQLVIIESSC